MTLRQRLRFLTWFAYHDLCEANALRTTWVNFVSVAIITTLSVLAFGIAAGTRALRLEEFQRKTLALCLWVGDPHLEGRLDPATVSELRRGLRAELGGAFLGLHPFDPLVEQWYQLEEPRPAPGGARPAARLPLAGRTVAPDDPLLNRLAARHSFVTGGPFSGPDAEGVIVTTTMLELLRPAGRSRAARPGSPETLAIEAINLPGQRMDLRVVGVIDAALPYEQQFVFTAAFARRFRELNAPVRSRIIRSGPVPAGWPPPGRLPERAARLLHREHPDYRIRGVSRRTRLDDDQPVWELETGFDEGLMATSWGGLLESVLAVMRAEGHEAPAEFATQMTLRDAVRLKVETEPAGRMAAIYVANIPAFRAAARLVGDRFGFPIDRELLDRLEEIDRQTNQALLAITALTVVLLVHGCAAMWGIQRLRSELKRTEIGMLKVLGMTGRALGWLYAYEAGLVWLAGSLLGIGLGIVCGWVLDGLGTDGRLGGVALGFRCPWWFLVCLPLGGAVFVGCAWGATSRERRASPILTLRAN